MAVHFRLVAAGAGLLLLGSLLLFQTDVTGGLPTALALVAGVGTATAFVRAGTDRGERPDRPL
jgi:hypothetical protein